MSEAIKKVQKRIKDLIKEGEKLLQRLEENTEEGASYFVDNYESWYSQTLKLIKKLLPERIDDFIDLYKGRISPRNLRIFSRLPPRDLRGDSIYGKEVIRLLRGQLAIFRTLKQLDKIQDIQELLYAEMFDSELEAAKELNRKGFHRAAGAVAGVVLESHLKKVCVNHNLTLPPEKTRSINKYNDMLKQAGIIDTPTWRHIQYLADLRNKCDHDRGSKPTKDEIDDLIKGVNKIIKTVF